jgi:hypothetical protein
VNDIQVQVHHYMTDNVGVCLPGLPYAGNKYIGVAPMGIHARLELDPHRQWKLAFNWQFPSTASVTWAPGAEFKLQCSVFDRVYRD